MGDLVMAENIAAGNSTRKRPGLGFWRFLSNAGTNNAITDIAGNRRWVPVSCLTLRGIRRQGRHRGFDNRRRIQCIIVRQGRIQLGRLSRFRKLPQATALSLASKKNNRSLFQTLIGISLAREVDERIKVKRLFPVNVRRPHVERIRFAHWL